MILRMPSYTDSFRCTADSCSDNCCIGWEIGIDRATADFYKNVGGEFGVRLRKCISDEDCFILTNERCPFLNEKNLCDIIINLGEDRLCQICSDHPRYFEWYGNIKEGGVGLCCEEGAILILSAEQPLSVTEKEIDDTEDEDFDTELFGFLYEARERIFRELSDESRDFGASVKRILSFVSELQYNIDNDIWDYPDFSEGKLSEVKVSFSDIFEAFSDFEAVDESWSTLLEQLKADTKEPTVDTDYSPYARRLFIYFIWRHFLKGVFDGEILSSVKFAAVSAAVILYIIRKEKSRKGALELKDIIDVCKLYSKQMEYSDENMTAFAELSYSEPCFSEEAVCGLLDF